MVVDFLSLTGPGSPHNPLIFCHVYITRSEHYHLTFTELRVSQSVHLKTGPWFSEFSYCLFFYSCSSISFLKRERDLNFKCASDSVFCTREVIDLTFGQLCLISLTFSCLSLCFRVLFIVCSLCLDYFCKRNCFSFSSSWLFGLHWWPDAFSCFFFSSNSKFLCMINDFESFNMGCYIFSLSLLQF